MASFGVKIYTNPAAIRFLSLRSPTTTKKGGLCLIHILNVLYFFHILHIFTSGTEDLSNILQFYIPGYMLRATNSRGQSDDPVGFLELQSLSEHYRRILYPWKKLNSPPHNLWTRLSQWNNAGVQAEYAPRPNREEMLCRHCCSSICLL